MWYTQPDDASKNTKSIDEHLPVTFDTLKLFNCVFKNVSIVVQFPKHVLCYPEHIHMQNTF